MFSIQVDRRSNKSTLVKGLQITPIFKMTEWNRMVLLAGLQSKHKEL
jgi:hypothetical protein